MTLLLRAPLFATLCSSIPSAQGWPTERPIRLIVPFQAGSSSDTIARIVSQKLAERIGQQIVVDNRVGASAMIGTEAVARSQPDGYTMGLANTTTHASATALSANPASLKRRRLGALGGALKSAVTMTASLGSPAAIRANIRRAADRRASSVR